MKSIARLSPLFVAGFLAFALTGCGEVDESEAGFEADSDSFAEGARDSEEGASIDEDAEALAAAEASVDTSACAKISSWSPTQAEKDVLTLVNQRRAKNQTCGGKSYPKTGALTFNANLACAARKHSEDMAAQNYFSHTGKDGSDPFTRMTKAGYKWSRAAENIAAGQVTADDVVTGWMNSTGHCTNIMDPNLKELGVGYGNSGSSTYKHYWTQDFGTK